VAKITIIGASSGIGLETVKRALACGHHVRAFSRSADRIPIDHASLEKYPGNALEADDVRRAVSGVDTVVQALGVPLKAETVLRPVDLFSSATRVLVSAMEEAAVQRLVCVTGFGAGDSHAHIGCLQRVPFELVLGRAYRDKDVQEALIRESTLDWIIARPGILTNGPRTGRYHALVEPRKWRNGIISRSNVADFLVKQIDDDAYVRKTPVLLACPL
jgi:putative NADH-flavin reductase